MTTEIKIDANGAPTAVQSEGNANGTVLKNDQKSIAPIDSIVARGPILLYPDLPPEEQQARFNAEARAARERLMRPLITDYRARHPGVTFTDEEIEREINHEIYLQNNFERQTRTTRYRGYA